MTTHPLRIVLPGGSGLIGQLLARHFHEQGHAVTVLTRKPYTAPWQTVHWDGEHTGPWTAYLEGADVCINLAGRSVNCRYTAKNRRAIYESRILSTRLIGKVIAGLAEPPRVWMNASAATIYRRELDANGVDLPREEAASEPDGDAPASEFLEKHPSGAEAPIVSIARTYGLKPVPFNATPAFGALPSEARWAERRGFARRVVRDWEAAFFAAETPRTRKIALRTSIVLSPTPGSAFAVLSNLVRVGLGGKQGSGRQFVSWIHAADYARAVEFLMARDGLSGPFNLAAPQPLANRAFMAALREAWDVPNGLPAPSLAIEIGAFFMRTESELVLESRRAIPGRLLDSGFEFEFPDWPSADKGGAAKDLVRLWKHRHD